MTDRTIIDAADRFIKKPLPSEAAVEPLWMRGKPDDFRAFHAPSVKTLPFVSAEWKNEYWPESMWIDVPTDDHFADRKRGEHFAKLTIEALMADRCNHGRALNAIFAAIVNDAIRRKAKGGKGSRTIPSAVNGFLDVLALYIATGRERYGD